VSADPVDVIARTVLYEGYLLYPYRRSALKNRQRFTFGVLYPKAFCVADAAAGKAALKPRHDSGRIDGAPRGGGPSGPPVGDRWYMQIECPVLGSGDTRLEIGLRFLQLVERPAHDGPVDAWREAIERQVWLDAPTVDGLQRAGSRLTFGFPDRGEEHVAQPGPTPALPAREAAVLGEIRVDLNEARAGVYRLTVRVANLAQVDAGATRDEALVRSLASAHAVIRVAGGELVSLLDPPVTLRDVAASCSNEGVWPVLVGEEGRCDCMLASPIILYDHPQVAPESTGDLFDGTEIDEILALRILTLTEDEKREARQSDARAREVLDRTEALTPEHWARLHGTVRGLRKIAERTP
jgi:hypothetical protein